jgi:hypothetical protein
MPSFALPGVDGRTVGDADLRGRVLLIRYWASW